MVAYNIPRQFRGAIRRREQRQMVSIVRTYNPRVGDPIQFYGGISGGHRVKLLTPEPICTELLPILIELDRNHPEIISAIRVAGKYLDDEQIEAFAATTGFGVNYPEGTARWRMGDVWQSKHGFELFQGVLIRWEPR